MNQFYEMETEKNFCQECRKILYSRKTAGYLINEMTDVMECVIIQGRSLFAYIHAFTIQDFIM